MVRAMCYYELLCCFVNFVFHYHYTRTVDFTSWQLRVYDGVGHISFQL